MADIEKFLELTTPEKIAEITVPCDSAYKTFPLEQTTVKNHAELIKIATEFYVHSLRTVYCHGSFEPPDPEFCRVKATGIIQDSEGKMLDAVQRARSGTGGGLLEVLRHMAEVIKKDILDKYISYVARQCIDHDDMTFKYITAFVKAYVKRYKRYLGHSAEHENPLLLTLRWKALIRNHILTVSEKLNKRGMTWLT